jgi:hypothetical protein
MISGRTGTRAVLLESVTPSFSLNLGNIDLPVIFDQLISMEVYEAIQIMEKNLSTWAGSNLLWP